MSIVDTAIQTQLNNIQTRTGKTFDQLFRYIEKSGLTKHYERSALPPGGMCQHRVVVTTLGEVDKKLLGWPKEAYLAAS